MIIKSITKPTGHENICHIAYATSIWGNAQAKGMGCNVTVASYKSKADYLAGKQADIETPVDIDATECIKAAVVVDKDGNKTFNAAAFYAKAEEIIVTKVDCPFFSGTLE
jgi:hypothetical protein